MEERDLLVIGSGFGGLTAGSLAAASNLDTLLLEQHTRPGGCAGDFALGGFAFPAGATVITGLEPGGILRRVVDSVGAHVESRPLDPSLTLHVAGRELPYAKSHDAWLKAFFDAFPDGPEGYRQFWEWAHRVGGIVYGIGAALPSLPIEGWADLRRSAGVLAPAAITTAPLLFQTVGDVKRRLRATGHGLADRIIDGLLIDATGATAETCSAIQGAIALDIYRRGCQWVEGGPARIAMALTRTIRANGGEVGFGERVLRLRRDRQGWMARTSTGRTIRARSVVANVPPAALDALLGRPVRKRAHEEAWGAFVLHLGIDGAGLAPVRPFHQVISPTGDHRGSAEGENCFVSIFPGRAGKADRWAISVSTHTRPERWSGNGSDIECSRRRMEEVMLAAVERVIPGVRGRVELLRSATPRTFEHYTLRPGGYVGGLVQRPNIVALRAPGHRVAGGLYIAGDHVFPGQGTVGVALAGINAYRDVCDHLGKRALL